MTDLHLTPETVEDAFCLVLSPGLGLPFYVENDLGPQPQGPYGTVSLQTGDPLNEIYDFEIRGEEVIEHLRGETYCTLSVALWGKGALSNALKARNLLNSHARQFDIGRLVGDCGTEAVQETSVAFLGKMQERAAFKVTFYANFGSSYPADWFDRSQWTISTNDHDKHHIFPPGD